MGYAVRRPENVSQFVAFDTAAFPSKRIPFSINICRIPGLVPCTPRPTLRSCGTHSSRKEERHLTPAVRAGYLNPYNSWTNRVAHLRFVQDIPMSQSHRSYGAWKQVADGLSQFQDKPMLIVWERTIFASTMSFLRNGKLLPAATVHYVEDAGHYVVEDAPEQIILGWNFFDGRATDSIQQSASVNIAHYLPR